jgi:hypothetical protein
MDLLDLSYHQIRATWEPLLATCIITNIHSTKLNMITTLITDVVLLLIMLIGLLRLGAHEPGVYGMGRFMWRQVRVFALLASRGVPYWADTPPVRKGIVWLLLATVAEIPPVVSVANSITHACIPHILNPLL